MIKIESRDMNVENFKKEIKRIRIVFNELTPQQRDILRSRWGFSFCRKKKLRELAEKYKVSYEGIRRIGEIAERRIEDCIKTMKD